MAHAAGELGLLLRFMSDGEENRSTDPRGVLTTDAEHVSWQTGRGGRGVPWEFVRSWTQTDLPARWLRRRSSLSVMIQGTVDELDVEDVRGNQVVRLTLSLTASTRVIDGLTREAEQRLGNGGGWRPTEGR